MELRDNSAMAHLTLDSVVRDILWALVEKNKFILLRNGAYPQIETVSKKVYSEFNKKYPSKEVSILDNSSTLMDSEKVYGLPKDKFYVLADYLNLVDIKKLDLAKKRDLFYIVDIKGCFGSNLPQ